MYINDIAAFRFGFSSFLVRHLRIYLSSYLYNFSPSIWNVFQMQGLYHTQIDEKKRHTK